MRVRMHVSVAGIVATLAAALVTAATAVAATPVEPATVSATLAPGGSMNVTKTVHTPAIPPNPDIVFLADTTGSMGAAASNVASNATTIMNDVNSAQPAGAIAEFAATEYLDGDPNFCPSDPYAFKVDQGLTTTLASVQAAMNTWPGTASLGLGCDTPESQLNALFQIATGAIAFRANSTRVVVWFGDSSGHDPSFGHTLAQVGTALHNAGITVIAVPVNSGFGDGLNSTGQASAIAAATNGQVLPSATPSQVTAAILAGLHNLLVTVTPDPSCSTGLTATYDAASKTVTSGTDAVFTETLTVAANAPAGALTCTVDFKLNGEHVDGFTQTVNINRPPVCTGATIGPDLWPPNHKLSHSLSISGVTDADGNPVTIAIASIFQDEPVNGLGDGDTGPADAAIDGSTFQVRAERSGLGDGRVYYVNFTASDGAGGTCTGTATIGVPHDQAHDPVGGGQLFNSIPF